MISDWSGNPGIRSFPTRYLLVFFPSFAGTESSTGVRPPSLTGINLSRHRQRGMCRPRSFGSVTIPPRAGTVIAKSWTSLLATGLPTSSTRGGTLPKGRFTGPHTKLGGCPKDHLLRGGLAYSYGWGRRTARHKLPSHCPPLSPRHPARATAGSGLRRDMPLG